MVEQYVEMYQIADNLDSQTAQNNMNDTISKGWQIKNIAVTPDTRNFYPIMYVVYEREVKTDCNVEKLIIK
jgi:hypothetical protein